MRVTPAGVLLALSIGLLVCITDGLDAGCCAYFVVGAIFAVPVCCCCCCR
jgi:hypothetical protein